MASSARPNQSPNSLYPQVLDSNPDKNSPFLVSSSSNLYPTLYQSPPSISQPHHDLHPNFYSTVDADNDDDGSATATSSVLVRIFGAIVHLIDRHDSVEIAAGDFAITNLSQDGHSVAVLAEVGSGSSAVSWPLAKDVVAVKLDDSHYFFTIPSAASGEEAVSYGLTFPAKGQEGRIGEMDAVLERYAGFSVQGVSGRAEVVDGTVAAGMAPSEMEEEPKREMMERRSAAYWTALAPNVEEYSSGVARVIAAGSGQVVKGILWCGDVTVDGLKWGNEVMKKRMEPNAKQTEISPEALKRMKRVKRVSKMSEKVATGVLSGVVKVSGLFTSSVVNSKVGKKFFSLLPGEVVLASLDGFEKICDAFEVAGKNVLSTSSVVTTGLVSHKHGEQAAELTKESLGAAGHAIGTAWAVFKIRKALNPKSAIKPTTLAKSAAKAAASEIRAKQSKS